MVTKELKITITTSFICVAISGFGLFEIISLQKSIDNYPVYLDHQRLYFKL